MKALKICTYMFLGVPIAMHYVRTLCDKYILSYDGFSWFLIGKFRHSVLNMWCRGRMGLKEHCCLCPFHFDSFYPILHHFSPEILIFWEQLIVET